LKKGAIFHRARKDGHRKPHALVRCAGWL
jgi:hypothetical protein